MHYSPIPTKEFVEASFNNLPNRERAENVKGILVNHHLLGARLISDALNVAASNKRMTIVLLSPNHFSRGRGNIIGSRYHWKTPYGILEPDKKITEQFGKTSISVDETPFPKEHGIFNLIPYIKRTFPNAKIMPLIIKDSLTMQESALFARKLIEILPRESLLIASLDFSHEVTSAVADSQDRASLEIIRNFKYDKLEDVKVDSKPALAIFLQFLGFSGATDFQLLNNTNSSKILKQDRTDTTSYITGFFTLAGMIK